MLNETFSVIFKHREIVEIFLKCIMKIVFLLHQDSVVWYSITTCLSFRFTTISWLSRCNCKKLMFLSTGPVSFNAERVVTKRKSTKNFHIFVSQKILQHCFHGYLIKCKKDVIDTHKIACHTQCLKIVKKCLILNLLASFRKMALKSKISAKRRKTRVTVVNSRFIKFSN